jgi:hypothetical protein
MVLNAILNALKSGLQRDPQRIEERSSTRSLNASKSDLQHIEGGIPFFLLRLRMRRNHNGLARRNYLRGLLLRANRGQPAGCGVAPAGLWGARTATLKTLPPTHGSLEWTQQSASLGSNRRERMGWDSNPRYPCGHAGFQDRCLKPLGHPSGIGLELVETASRLLKIM